MISRKREIPLKMIEEILQESTLAPSASNNQPCRFVVVQCRKTIKALSDESKANLLSDNAEKKIKLNPDYVAFLQNENFNVFYNAPCVIYIVGAKSVGSLDVDAALAASYIMFSAAARGLGTCWVALGANIRDPQLKSRTGHSRQLPDCRADYSGLSQGDPRAVRAARAGNSPRDY